MSDNGRRVALVPDPTFRGGWIATMERTSRAARFPPERLEEETDGRRDHEQIRGSNARSVVTQKGLPPLTGRSTSFHHVLGDG